MSNDTLLEKAQANLQVAEVSLNVSSDDAIINIVAYHLQQAVELALKHILEISGIRYPKTHAIEELVELLPKDVSEISDILGDSAYMFTSWEAKTRYVKGFRVSLKEIDRGMQKTRAVLQEAECYTARCCHASDASGLNPIVLE